MSGYQPPGGYGPPGGPPGGGPPGGYGPPGGGPPGGYGPPGGGPPGGYGPPGGGPPGGYGGPPGGGPPGGYGGPPGGGPPGGYGGPPGGGPPGGYGGPPGGGPPGGYGGPPPGSGGGGGGFARYLPIVFAVGMGLIGTGVVVAQTVFGIEIPIIGRFFGGGKGGSSGPNAKAEFKKLGISYDKADPNEIIDKLEKRARAWRKDAKFYSMHINELQSDGTLDFSTHKPTMTVEFFSPSLVGSSSSADYKKGIRKFAINYVKIDEQVWGTKKSYPDVPGTPIPKCKMKDLTKLLKDKGKKLTDKSRISVGLDPGFAFATKGLSLNVNGKDPKLHVYADIDTCEIIKEP